MVIGITAIVLLIFYSFAVLFKFSPIVYNQVLGTGGSIPTLRGMQRVVLIDHLSSLPIILGLALMIKLVKRWWQKQKEIETLAKEKTKAELQLLKAQVHPHFLFNTLNNIYFFTLTNSTQAPGMIKKLSGMLQYILNECNLPLVYLEKEIEMISDYMALEKIRYPEHMEMTIDIEDGLHNKMIAPLLLIPFVENSFKHGASKMISQPWIKLKIYIENNWLNFTIINSKPPTNEPAISQSCQVNLPDREADRQGNIGLKNVTKRLELLYPGTHELNIVSASGSYAVYLKLQLQDHTIAQDEIKNLNEYAMA